MLSSQALTQHNQEAEAMRMKINLEKELLAVQLERIRAIERLKDLEKEWSTHVVHWQYTLLVNRTVVSDICTFVSRNSYEDTRIQISFTRTST